MTRLTKYSFFLLLLSRYFAPSPVAAAGVAPRGTSPVGRTDSLNNLDDGQDLTRAPTFSQNDMMILSSAERLFGQIRASILAPVTSSYSLANPSQLEAFKELYTPQHLLLYKDDPEKIASLGQWIVLLAKRSDLPFMSRHIRTAIKNLDPHMRVLDSMQVSNDSITFDLSIEWLLLRFYVEKPQSAIKTIIARSKLMQPGLDQKAHWKMLNIILHEMGGLDPEHALVRSITQQLDEFPPHEMLQKNFKKITDVTELMILILQHYQHPISASQLNDKLSKIFYTESLHVIANSKSKNPLNIRGVKMLQVCLENGADTTGLTEEAAFKSFQYLLDFQETESEESHVRIAPKLFTLLQQLNETNYFNAVYHLVNHGSKFTQHFLDFILSHITTAKQLNNNIRVMVSKNLYKEVVSVFRNFSISPSMDLSEKTQLGNAVDYYLIAVSQEEGLLASLKSIVNFFFKFNFPEGVSSAQSTSVPVMMPLLSLEIVYKVKQLVSRGEVSEEVQVFFQQHIKTLSSILSIRNKDKDIEVDQKLAAQLDLIFKNVPQAEKIIKNDAQPAQENMFPIHKRTVGVAALVTGTVAALAPFVLKKLRPLVTKKIPTPVIEEQERYQVHQSPVQEDSPTESQAIDHQDIFVLKIKELQDLLNLVGVSISEIKKLQEPSDGGAKIQFSAETGDEEKESILNKQVKQAHAHLENVERYFGELRKFQSEIERNLQLIHNNLASAKKSLVQLNEASTHQKRYDNLFVEVENLKKEFLEISKITDEAKCKLQAADKAHESAEQHYKTFNQDRRQRENKAREQGRKIDIERKKYRDLITRLKPIELGQMILGRNNKQFTLDSAKAAALEFLSQQQEHIINAMLQANADERKINFNQTKTLVSFVFELWQTHRQSLNAPAQPADPLPRAQEQAPAQPQVPIPVAQAEILEERMASGGLSLKGGISPDSSLEDEGEEEREEKVTAGSSASSARYGKGKAKALSLTPDLWYQVAEDETLLKTKLDELRIIGIIFSEFSQHLRALQNSPFDDITRQAYRRTAAMYLVKTFDKFCRLINSIKNGEDFIKNLIHYANLKKLRDGLAHHTYMGIDEQFDQALVNYLDQLSVLAKIDINLINAADFMPFVNRITDSPLDISRSGAAGKQLYSQFSHKRLAWSYLDLQSLPVVERLGISLELIRRFAELKHNESYSPDDRHAFFMALNVEITVVCQIYADLEQIPGLARLTQYKGLYLAVNAFRDAHYHDDLILLNDDVAMNAVQKLIPTMIETLQTSFAPPVDAYQAPGTGL